MPKHVPRSAAPNECDNSCALSRSMHKSVMFLAGNRDLSINAENAKSAKPFFCCSDSIGLFLEAKSTRVDV